MTEQWQLAQMNVGTMRYDREDRRMSGFMTRLDEINALADSAPGFVWRLQSDSGNATDIDVGGDPRFIVNMSVWVSLEALYHYVYQTTHRDVMVLRRHWFQRPDSAYQVLWWVPAGHRPAPEEGLARLQHLQRHGPSGFAFTFKQPFAAPGRDQPPGGLDPEDFCSGWR